MSLQNFSVPSGSQSGARKTGVIPKFLQVNTRCVSRVALWKKLLGSLERLAGVSISAACVGSRPAMLSSAIEPAFIRLLGHCVLIAALLVPAWERWLDARLPDFVDLLYLDCTSWSSLCSPLDMAGWPSQLSAALIFVLLCFVLSARHWVSRLLAEKADSWVKVFPVGDEPASPVQHVLWLSRSSSGCVFTLVESNPKIERQTSGGGCIWHSLCSQMACWSSPAQDWQIRQQLSLTLTRH